LDAITLKREVMRARVELWNVARRLSCVGLVEEGRYKVVDSPPEISRIRWCVAEWSSV
jgi:hypothetical protein